ncbi:gluconate 2-dehydrogenase subunit 3 family protein [uncultured Algibacter sp.]|uniref:gluconate 2-dehydrogenase subunit 3 family protein n=1 Tax=uncultured Algibacter sp. TaxID=298659 RepID=UPI00261F3C66|nr:gluconate 2-dehydrogenase subunit 3 family protein [uncultured Algibacter sp.]
MNRRDALKNLTMGLGYTVATPTIMNLFASCKAETNDWTPLFLSEDEKLMVTNLVDIIIPPSDTPGALDVNIPQFLDLMYHDIEIVSNQDTFKEGAKQFANNFKKSLGKEASEGTREDYETLVSKYFNLSDKDSEEILKSQRKNNVTPDELESYNLYKFLLSVRYYTIFGYCTSEKIGEEVLAYDPIPGSYNGCVSLKEISNNRAWSL